MTVVIIEKLTGEDVKKAREEYPEYIKITADISQKIVAIGGGYYIETFL